MVDVLKKLDFDYVAINPGSAFAGLHESLINYSGNKSPEILTALHEEAAIAMAHGYAKAAAGKPMLVCVHGTVGMLHGSMALFQAWADRVPVFLIVGQHRNPNGIVNLPHSAQDMGSIVRDFVKFDDETTTLERFAESTLRAYQIATTPPMGPVLLSVDADLQEETIETKDRPRIPELVRPSPPQGESAAVREAARLLVNAEIAAAASTQARTHAVRVGSDDRAGRDAAGAGRRRHVRILAGFPVVASALGKRWRRLPRRRDARTRDERHVGARARRPHERTQDDQHFVEHLFHTATSTITGVTPTSISRLPATRGDAASADRGGQEAAHRRSQTHTRRSRREGRRGAQARRTSVTSRTRAMDGEPSP
jgi:hypothetical protein